MAFPPGDQAGSERPRWRAPRHIARYVFPPVVLVSALLVYITKTGLDLFILLLVAIAIALVAREVTEFLARRMGLTTSALIVLVLFAAAWIGLGDQEGPVAQAVLRPLRLVLGRTEQAGYTSVLVQSSATRAPSIGSPGPSAASPTGTGPATPAGSSGPAGPSREGTAGEQLSPSTPAGTSTVLSLSDAMPALGEPITFTAEVRSSSDDVPSGRVVFVINGKVIRRPRLTRDGGAAAATLTLSQLKAGAYDVVARYEGSPGFRPSQSATQRLLVRRSTR